MELKKRTLWPEMVCFRGKISLAATPAAEPIVLREEQQVDRKDFLLSVSSRPIADELDRARHLHRLSSSLPPSLIPRRICVHIDLSAFRKQTQTRHTLTIY